MLCRLPDYADPTSCEEASDRLYLSPVAPDAEVDDKAFTLENVWKEFIGPELRSYLGIL